MRDFGSPTVQDNFSVASAEVCWLLMSLMVAVAMWARRGNYQLFVYTHHLAIGVFVTVIVHAWSAWCVSSSCFCRDCVVSLSLTHLSCIFSNVYDIGN
jgi:hypothetical protein